MPNFLLIIYFLTISSPSFAYVDPGTGSLILQILGSILVGLIFYFNIAKLKVKNFLNKFFKKKNKG